MNLIKKIFNMFKNTPKEDLSYLLPEDDNYNFKIPMDRIIANFDHHKKTILIIDDSKGIVSIVEDFIKDCHNQGTINLDEYNVLAFYDKYAPFVMERTLLELNITKVDYAILDIVLPGRMRLQGKQIKKDGIDVSILLNEKYDCTNFCFFTGNVVSEYVDYISAKLVKFHKHFNREIDDFIIHKGDNSGEETVSKFNELFTKNRYVV